MFEYRLGNIIEARTEAVVNTVNCVGVMGRGIALQFKRAYPDNFRAYSLACRREEVRVGRMFVYEREYPGAPQYIINFPTKRHWRNKSRLDDVRIGLEALVDEISTRQIRSIAVPPLGCGLGGLDWRLVRPMIEDALGGCGGLQAIVFQPNDGLVIQGAAHDYRPKRMMLSQALLICLMELYQTHMKRASIPLVDVHSLMYLMHLVDDRLKLSFRRGMYGPLATDLRHLSRYIEGPGISEWGDDDRFLSKRVALKPNVTMVAHECLATHDVTRHQLHRVGKLLEDADRVGGVELLATVHWLTANGRVDGEEELICKAHDWHPCKERFSPKQILKAADMLVAHGWIDSLGSPPLLNLVAK